MSSTPSARSEAIQPAWLRDLLGSDGPGGSVREIGGQSFVVTRGIRRSKGTPASPSIARKRG